MSHVRIGKASQNLSHGITPAGCGREWHAWRGACGAGVGPLKSSGFAG